MKEPIDWQKELLETAQHCFEIELMAGTSGNLSLFDRENKVVYITPSSIPYSTMTANDIVGVDLDGNKLFGEHRPSSEVKMHTIIYKKRADVNAIVHTHAPYATSFAVVNQEIPVILIEMIPYLGGAVQVAEFALPGTQELGESALEKLIDRKGTLLANHGTITIGDTLTHAFESAVYLEDAAKIYHFSRQLGSVHVLSDEIIRAMKGEA